MNHWLISDLHVRLTQIRGLSDAVIISNALGEAMREEIAVIRQEIRSRNLQWEINAYLLIPVSMRTSADLLRLQAAVAAKKTARLKARRHKHRVGENSAHPLSE